MRKKHRYHGFKSSQLQEKISEETKKLKSLEKEYEQLICITSSPRSKFMDYPMGYFDERLYSYTSDAQLCRMAATSIRRDIIKSKQKIEELKSELATLCKPPEK